MVQPQKPQETVQKEVKLDAMLSTRALGVRTLRKLYKIKFCVIST